MIVTRRVALLGAAALAACGPQPQTKAAPPAGPAWAQIAQTGEGRINVPGGSLTEGQPADITILAPEQSVTIDRAALVSKSKNTPYHGHTFRGVAAATIVGGRVVFANNASGLALAAEGR